MTDVDHERILAPSPFPGDDGTATELTREALAATAVDPAPTTYFRAVTTLCSARLLVPVVATATRVGETVDGLTSDKEAEMSVVMLQAADGRRALLAFTGLDSLQQWRADARPVPVTIDLAAKTAVGEGVDAVLIDVAGPQPLAIDGEVLTQLAAGHRLIETGPDAFGWAIETPPGVDPNGAS